MLTGLLYFKIEAGLYTGLFVKALHVKRLVHNHISITYVATVWCTHIFITAKCWSVDLVMCWYDVKWRDMLMWLDLICWNDLICRCDMMSWFYLLVIVCAPVLNNFNIGSSRNGIRWSFLCTFWRQTDLNIKEFEFYYQQLQHLSQILCADNLHSSNISLLRTKSKINVAAAHLFIYSIYKHLSMLYFAYNR